MLRLSAGFVAVVCLLSARPAVPPAEPQAAARATPSVPAVAQTDEVGSENDAADDPAIWVHPTQPEKSLILGTDKQIGVAVYTLSGKRVQFLDLGRVNNIDLRSGFPISPEKTIDLAAASQRDRRSVVLLAIDRTTGTVSDLGCEFKTGLKEPYGLCMYRSATSGFYVFVCDKESRIEQWKLHPGSPTPEGTPVAPLRVRAELVRAFSRPSQCEGMAADDASGILYFAEEASGIYACDAEPDAPAAPREIELVSAGRLHADVEGLTIARASDAGAARVRLFASSQGDSTFAVFDVTDVASSRWLGSFRIAPNTAAGIDAVQETDGLDIVTTPLGPRFPHGLLVAQDGVRDASAERQNFKLVPLDDVMAAILPPAR